MTEATPASRPAVVPVGEALQAARLGRSLSLEDVAGRTRVPLRHLNAIERANMAELPAVPYAVGFVKSYARVVGLDPDALASQFRGEIAGIGDGRRVVPSFEPADPARVPPRWVAVVALALVIAIAAAYVLMRNGAFGGDGAEDRARLAAGTGATVAAAEPAAPVAAPPPVAPTPANDGAVAVTAAEPVWVKIYDGAQTLFIGSMAAGQRFDVPAGAAAPMIWTGRPESIRVTVGSTAIPPLGPPSRRVKDVSLKAPALLARTAPGSAAAAGTGATPAAGPSGFDAPGNAG